MRYPVFLLAVLLTGCGYVGDPQPPALNIPVAVADLRVLEYGENLIVEFTAPALTTESLAIERLRGAELRIGLWPAGTNVNDWMGTAQVLPLPVDQPGAVSQSIPVAKEWIGKEILIVARTFGPKGRVSPNSNLLFLPVEAPLARPAGLRAENHPEGVKLTWTGAAGKYRVLRATEDAAPAALAEVEAREFLDNTSIYGIRYGYQVQALGDKAQSETTDRAVVTPVDVFPPAAPAGLTTVAGPAGIDLAWERNTESDFKAYRVYRALGDGALQQLAEIDTPSYVDRAVESGKRYRYQVSSVDQLGNESPRTLVAEVTMP